MSRKPKKKKVRQPYNPRRHPHIAAASDWQDFESSEIEAHCAAGPLDFEEDGRFSDPDQVASAGGVLLRISGPLAIEDYLAIAAMARQLAEAGPKSVGIIYRTPGGTTIGMTDAAEALAALPHEAFAHRASSAGYLLAAQARRLTADPHGMIGSLGVLREIRDTSKAFAAEGVRVDLITDGSDLKGINAAGVPQTSQMKEFTQSQVRRGKRQFLEAIAAARGSTFESISAAAGEGGEYTALEALDRGLIDRVETLAAFERRILGTQENTMPQKKPTAMPSPTAQADPAAAVSATPEPSPPGANPPASGDPPAALQPAPAPTTPQWQLPTATAPGLAEAITAMTEQMKAQAAKIAELQEQIVKGQRDQELAQATAGFESRLSRLNLSSERSEAVMRSIGTTLASGGDPEPVLAALEEQAGAYAHQLARGTLGQELVVHQQNDKGDDVTLDLSAYAEPGEGGQSILTPARRAQAIEMETALAPAGNDKQKRLAVYRDLWERSGGFQAIKARAV